MNTLSSSALRQALCLGMVLAMGLALATNTALAERGEPQATAEAAAAAGFININTATAEELARLPGVGPSRAEAILKVRGQLKRFKRIEDIMRVRGVGRKTFRRLRPMLRVDGETTLSAPRTKKRK